MNSGNIPPQGGGSRFPTRRQPGPHRSGVAGGTSRFIGIGGGGVGTGFPGFLCNGMASGGTGGSSAVLGYRMGRAAAGGGGGSYNNNIANPLPSAALTHGGRGASPISRNATSGAILDRGFTTASPDVSSGGRGAGGWTSTWHFNNGYGVPSGLNYGINGGRGANPISRNGDAGVIHHQCGGDVVFPAGIYPLGAWLVLLWPKTFGQDLPNLTMHGVWNYVITTSKTTQPVKVEPKRWKRTLLEDMNRWFPNIIHMGMSNFTTELANSTFWNHEFKFHGLATGLKEEPYFEASLNARRAFEKFGISDLINSLKGERIYIAELQILIYRQCHFTVLIGTTGIYNDIFHQLYVYINSHGRFEDATPHPQGIGNHGSLATVYIPY